MTISSGVSRPTMLNNLLDWFDQLPRLGKIALMVGGFILFWPIGLGILGYLIWSGQMGCKHGRSGWGERGWGPGSFRGHYRSSGNMAFDEYREATLRQLEEDQKEFTAFLDKLRRAKDQREFDDFMADRMHRKTQENGNGNRRPDESRTDGE